ncbi:MAG: hypothetical protein R3B13_09130 [Polyangiaceae bacterium]
MILSRRQFGSACLVLASSCQPRAPETPLAHLYGRDWVTGAYTHYADAHRRVEGHARDESVTARRVLAQQGVDALAMLQRREVPFWVRVSADSQSFRVERSVPERLTFTANMSADERNAATRAWKLAREHIQQDYEDVRALDGALGRLLASVGELRHAVDVGGIEQFRICRQLTVLDEGGELPFQLPYQVSRDDYRSILLLLLDRLETEGQRLERLESSLVAMGLTARAADSGSLSLSRNLEKVLLSVDQDAANLEAADTQYPEGEAQSAAMRRALALRARIVASPEYVAWLRAERAAMDVIGQFLSIIDTATGLPASALYRQILGLWRGDGDYLDFLQLAMSMVPGGTALRSTLDQAVDHTQRARRMLRKAEQVSATLRGAREDGSALLEQGGLLNVATSKAQALLPKQLVFYEQAEEAERVRQELRERMR